MFHFPFEMLHSPFEATHPFTKVRNVSMKAQEKSRRGEPQRNNRYQFKTNIHGSAGSLSMQVG